MPVCSSCGTKLGHPEDEVEHPEDDDPPEDAHFKVQIRSDGAERAQCKQTGQLASVVVGNDKVSPLTGDVTGKVETGGDVGEGGRSGRQGPEEDDGRVFDFPEEKSQLDILKDVIENPRYELNSDQIAEVVDWAEDYNGQMPPDVLEDLLANMEGIQKQSAKLMRNKYELKINNWIREQSNNDDGPPIGALAKHRAGPPSSSGGPKRSTPTPSPPQNNGNQNGKKRPSPPRTNVSRAERRQERRQEALDKMTDEFALTAAQNMAEDFGSAFTEMREFFFTLIRKKAEKDPDWFFEKAEEWDMDILDEFMSESEAKQRESETTQPSQPMVDQELDNVMSELGGGADTQVQPTPTAESYQTEHQPAETTKSSPAVQDTAETQDGTDDMVGDEDDDGFDEIFGEYSDETEQTQVQ